MAQFIHAVIISWKGKHGQARQIAAAIAAGNLASIKKISVMASHPESLEDAETDRVNWHFLPDEQFFGPKFAAGLAATGRDEVMLLIHADTEFDDWPRLVNRCSAAFERNADLAVWAPDFTWSPYRTEIVRLNSSAPSQDELLPVMQTDGIIVGLSPEVQGRLHQMDCASNNLGWGIDWAAIGWAYAHGKQVLRDTGLCVTHLRSRSYGSANADLQMKEFFKGLSEIERRQIGLLAKCIRHEQDLARPRLRRVWNILRGKKDQAFF